MVRCYTWTNGIATYQLVRTMGLEPEVVKELRKMEKKGILHHHNQDENNDSYQSSIQDHSTERIEKSSDNSKRFSYDDLTFQPAWQIEKPSSDFFYKTGIIPGKIFFSKLGGNITVQKVETSLNHIKKAFVDGKFANTSYIRIVDYSKVKNASIQARRIYGKFITHLNETYNAHPKISFICGASPFLKMALNLFANHVNQHFVFVESVEEAFNQLNQQQTHEKRSPTEEKLVSQKEIESLIDKCGDILWDEQEASNKKGTDILSHDSPLYPIAEALSILNQDLKELQEKDREKTNQLIDSEQRLRGFFDQSYDGMRLVNENGIIVDVSNSMQRITGLKREEVIGSYIWDVIYNYASTEQKTPEFYERIKEKSLKLLQTKDTSIIQGHEHSLIRPDGKKRIVQSTSFPIKIGEKYLFGSIIKDVTDQKEAERKIRESEKRYKTLAENFPDGALFLFDKDLRFIFCDGKGLKKAGLTKEDVIGKTVKEVFNPEQKKIIERHCYPVFQGKTSQYELTYNGKQYTNQTVPVYNDEGRITEGIVITQEITKQKRNERKLKEQRKKLADSNRQLVRMNEELQDAQEALQSVNAQLQRKVEEKTANIQKLVEQKDDFIHMLSHDLKNPLTPILTLLPLLKQKSENPKVKEMIDKIILNTQRMKTIIQETLTLAKLSEQGTKIHLSKFNLKEEIERVLNDNKPFLDQYQVTIHNHVQDDQYVFFDKSQFHHVLNNLISNAVKYTPEDMDCHLEIFSVSKEKSINLSVKDNGIGLSTSQQKQVFEKFFKDAIPRDGMESTGLGLSICKRIIENHGGRIWAESPGAGKGSTFSFTLPINSNQ